jgi:hypothetical protein
MSETKVVWAQDLVALYRDATRKVIRKARDEKAVFPLRLSMTNRNGESWGADVTLVGRDFDVRHDKVDVALEFPLRIVAIDSVGDQVAVMTLHMMDLGEEAN